MQEVVQSNVFTLEIAQRSKVTLEVVQSNKVALEVVGRNKVTLDIVRSNRFTYQTMIKKNMHFSLLKSVNSFKNFKVRKTAIKGALF